MRITAHRATLINLTFQSQLLLPIDLNWLGSFFFLLLKADKAGIFQRCYDRVICYVNEVMKEAERGTGLWRMPFHFSCNSVIIATNHATLIHFINCDHWPRLPLVSYFSTRRISKNLHQLLDSLRWPQTNKRESPRIPQASWKIMAPKINRERSIGIWFGDLKWPLKFN